MRAVDATARILLRPVPLFCKTFETHYSAWAARRLRCTLAAVLPREVTGEQKIMIQKPEAIELLCAGRAPRAKAALKRLDWLPLSCKIWPADSRASAAVGGALTSIRTFIYCSKLL